MTRAQFNPSTLKASYNPVTKRQQVLTGTCDVCTDFGFDTPTQVKITFAGILSCYGIGCCEEKKANTGSGIGWGGEFILNQGRITWPSGIPGWFDSVPHALPCWYGAIYYGDYGGWDLYNLNDCLGGILEHFDYYCFVPRIQILKSVGKLIVDITAHLCFTGVELTTCYQIFHGNKDFGATPPCCMPYDVTFDNLLECTGDDMPCMGDGTAIITEWG